MQSHWANSAPYYRCRFPAEYALANRVEHPLNVCLREDAILGEVDGWLARQFAPHRLRRTLADLAAAQDASTSHPVGQEETRQQIAACDRKLAQYRAALDAGAARPPSARGSQRPRLSGPGSREACARTLPARG
jgi:site-specific DNA recombinase